MIETAKVIPFEQSEGVGLFDEVLVYLENLKQEKTLRVSTALRQDAMHGIVSKDSPVGKALLGHQEGERVAVEVSPDVKYYVEIRRITKAKGDDDSLEIRGY